MHPYTLILYGVVIILRGFTLGGGGNGLVPESCAAPQTVAFRAPLSTGYLRQERRKRRLSGERLGVVIAGAGGGKHWKSQGASFII